MPLPRSKRLPWLISHLCAPTVLVTALLMFTPLRFPQVSWPHALVATTFTMLIPWAVLVWARKTGKVSDIHITRREQRWPLLLTALASILLGLALMVWLRVEPVLLREVLLILSGLLITGGITLRWKISIHVAVAAFVALHILEDQPFGAAVAVAVVGILSWSRVQLRHHTSSQVFAGAVVGAMVSLFALLPMSG